VCPGWCRVRSQRGACSARRWVRRVVSDRVLPAPLAELAIEGNQRGTLRVGMHREIVVLNLSKPGLGRCPAFVGLRNKHAADTGWNVVVEEEPHEGLPNPA
jgi:hypothetical protein